MDIRVIVTANDRSWGAEEVVLDAASTDAAVEQVKALYPDAEATFEVAL